MFVFLKRLLLAYREGREHGRKGNLPQQDVHTNWLLQALWYDGWLKGGRERDDRLSK